MNRSDLVRLVARQADIPQRDADLAVRAVFGSISNALRGGDRIEIRGFGSFRTRDYEGYTGTNPRTGTPVSVGRKLLPQFRPSKALRTAVDYDASSARLSSSWTASPLPDASPGIRLDPPELDPV